MNGMTTRAHCRAPYCLNLNLNQNAARCSLKQSKRATSLGVIIGQIITGYPAISNSYWTCVAARKIIAIEI
jgi:hypothetical protein